MSRAFRIRQLKSSIRTRQPFRTLFADSEKTSHTPEEQTRFLRWSDQNLLRETAAQIDAVTKQMDTITEQMKTMRTVIEVPITVKTVSDSRVVQYSTASVPYVNGPLRQRILEIPKAFEAALKQADHVRTHLIDLQTEPYSDDSIGLGKWQTEIAKMTREQQEEELKNIEYDRQATAERVKREVQKVTDLVNKIEALRRKSPDGKFDDAPPKPNPFAKEEGKKGSTVKNSDAPAKAEKEKAAPSNILDLQKRLEEQMKKGNI